MTDSLEDTIATALKEAPEQGDWPWEDHCEGVASFVVQRLRAAGVVPAEPATPPWPKFCPICLAEFHEDGTVTPGEPVVPAEPAIHDTPLSVEEATWTDCPEPPTGPWRWSGPINAIVSDSHKFGTPWEQTLAIARWSIENLYRSGFAIVAVAAVGGEAPAT